MIGRFRFLLKNSPLFRRMFLVTSFSVLLTLLVTSGANLILTRRIIRNDNLELSNTLTSQIAVNLGHRLTAIDDDIFGTYVGSILNRPWPTIESIRSEGGLEKLQNELMTQQALENILYSHRYVTSVVLIDPSQEVYSAGPAPRIDQFVSETDILADIRALAGAPLWMPFDESQFIMARALYDTSALTYMGLLFCILDSEYLIEVISDTSDYSENFYYVVDSADHSLFVQPKDLRSGIHLDGLTNRSSRYRYIGKQIPGTGLSLIMARSYRAIDRVYRLFVLIILLAGILAVSVVGFINFKVASRFYRNVQTLLSGIEGFGQSRDSLEIVRTGDEIQQLSEGISSMADRIANLIERVSLERVRVQQAKYDALEARYSALMSQVNPHFIYNALEAISSHALLQDDDEISRIAINLGRMLRLSVKRTQTYSPLGEEIGFIRDLVETYRLIYENPFEYREIIPEDCRRFEVPTFILLPLVENAIVHGLQSSDHQGELNIHVEKRADKRLELSITDNGVGISDTDIPNVVGGRKVPSEDSWEHTRIGIPGVIERLNILYGDAAKFDIRSQLDRGTTVTVIVPGRLESGI